MTNSATSAVPPDILQENKESVHSFLQDTYAETKKQLQQGITVFKEEFTEIKNKAGEYFHLLTLPVNNFLKDLTQIEKEFEFESQKEIIPVMEFSTGCNFIPIDQISFGDMEENY
jgi:hypothetical protein